MFSLLAGCVTTGDGQNKKWEKAERSELHTQMGVNYFQKGQIEVAREEFELALDIDPNNSRAHLAMAHLQQRLGDEDKASNHFYRAVRTNRENITAKNDYGFFLCRKGEYESGLRQLSEALNHPLNKRQEVSLFGAAECQRLAGKTDSAVEYYETALRLQPDMRPALFQMARINFDRNEYLKARAYLERFFQNRFYTDEGLLLAVRNELKLGRRKIASDYARQLRAKFPKSGLIQELRPLFNGE